MRNTETIHHVLRTALNIRFSSNKDAMAKALRMELTSLEQALADGKRQGVITFERLSVYCLHHKLSLDILLAESNPLA